MIFSRHSDQSHEDFLERFLSQGVFRPSRLLSLWGVCICKEWSENSSDSRNGDCGWVRNDHWQCSTDAGFIGSGNSCRTGKVFKGEDNDQDGISENVNDNDYDDYDFIIAF